MENERGIWVPLMRDITAADAVFAGWQETGSGEAFALYTIVARANPFRGSTVSESTLRKMNLGVPETPPYEGEISLGTSPGSCGECPVEARCIGPYRSRTGCSAFPADENWDGARHPEIDHEHT